MRYKTTRGSTVAFNSSRFAILGLLTLRPMSGYDIRKTYETSVGNFWRESYGQIYPILKVLENEGLVTQSEASGGRKRREYSITPRGRQVVRQWLDQPAALAAPRNEFLLKLFFGEETDVDVSVRQLARFSEEHQSLLRHYAELEQYLTTAHGNNKSLQFWLMTLEYGKAESRALLEWCERAKAVLNKMSKPASRPKKQRK